MRLFLSSTNFGYSLSFSSLTVFNLARRSSSCTRSSSICFLTLSSLLFISSILFSPVFCSSWTVLLNSSKVLRLGSKLSPELPFVAVAVNIALPPLSLSRTTSLTDCYNIKNIFFVILRLPTNVINIHFNNIYSIQQWRSTLHLYKSRDRSVH